MYKLLNSCFKVFIIIYKCVWFPYGFFFICRKMGQIYKDVTKELMISHVL